MRKISKPHIISFLLTSFTLLSGCSTLSGPSLTTERYMACPQESVWEGALEALEHYPITTEDKSEGIIETDWRVQPVQSRGFGLFNRQIPEKERSQLTFSMKPLQEGVVAIKLTERRHHWGFVGGQQLYRWYAVEPSQQEVNNFMNRLTAKLDQEGCIVES